MSKLERFVPSPLKNIKASCASVYSSVVPAAVGLIAKGELFPKEDNFFTPNEWHILRSGLTVIAVGGLLIAEAARRRTMEAAYSRDRKLSIAGTALRTLGTGAVLSVLWTIDRI